MDTAIRKCAAPPPQKISSTMVAPTRVKRDVADPLSRLQRSGSRIVRLYMLGVLGLAILGVFLLKSMRPKTLPNVISNQKEAAASNFRHQKEETLLLTTKHGTIRIAMRPDLSSDSVEYIRELVVTLGGEKCQDCNLYRAEKNFLLQGIMKNPTAQVKITKGACPPGYDEKTDDCPPEQFACGCHGPTMTRGLVGWAAGDTGPDFFIDTNKDPVTDWGQTHTVFGQVKEDASFAVIQKIYELPSTHKGLTMLNDKIDFTLSMK